MATTAQVRSEAVNHRPDRPGTPELPQLITEVPGPRSRAIFRKDQSLLAAGNSAGSLWSELALVEGRGAMIRDADGNWLLDACAGTVVMNLGHGHPAVAEALGEQARLLTHFYDFATDIRVRFVELLKSTLPESLDAFHLANSGSEAVEAALRTVRSATGRHEVIAFHNGYHGRTLGALSLTSGAGREGLGPFLPGVVHAVAPDPMASPHRKEAERVDECGKHLDRVVSQVLSAPPAAVIIEPMQGAGGMIPVPTGFLELLRAFCDRTGALLIFDEILTGAAVPVVSGRTSIPGWCPTFSCSARALAADSHSGSWRAPASSWTPAPARSPPTTAAPSAGIPSLARPGWQPSPPSSTRDS